MHNLDPIKAVYVIIDDSDRRRKRYRRGLFIDGELVAVGKDKVIEALTVLYQGGWSGIYEQMNICSRDAFHFCEYNVDFPPTLAETVGGMCGATGAGKFPGELD